MCLFVCVYLNSDGQYLATASLSGTMAVWDIARSATLHRLPHPVRYRSPVVADEIGNNYFDPYKQPYSPRRRNTMHATEKLCVHAKPAIPCVLRLHANVRSTISWHAATDFSVFTWRTVYQRHSHVKDRLEFRVIQSY